MIPKQVIEKAIEAGWPVERWGGAVAYDCIVRDVWECVALIPSFWQALGKALGWSDKKDHEGIGGYYPEWQYHAQCFYDLVLTGGDTKKFWEEVLGEPLQALKK